VFPYEAKVISEKREHFRFFFKHQKGQTPGIFREKGSPAGTLLSDNIHFMQPLIIHDSRNTTYRYPFGAVEAGSVVTLRCEVEGDGTELVTLRLWQEGAGETLVAMQQEKCKQKTGEKKEEKLRYVCQITVPAFCNTFLQAAGIFLAANLNTS